VASDSASGIAAPWAVIDSVSASRHLVSASAQAAAIVSEVAASSRAMVATGQPSPLTDELAGDLLPAARAIAEPLRAYGVFAAVVPPAADDTAAATLLRFLGRDPHWSA